MNEFSYEQHMKVGNDLDRCQEFLYWLKRCVNDMDRIPDTIEDIPGMIDEVNRLCSGIRTGMESHLMHSYSDMAEYPCHIQHVYYGDRKLLLITEEWDNNESGV